MSEQQSGLTPLSREDLKNLKKLAEREKRNEQAKTAKIGPIFTEPAMPASVSFDAPVKISSSEDTDKVTDVLGDYKNFSSLMLSSRRSDIVGVERQPPTPLPNRKFFSKSGENSASVENRSRDLSRHHTPSANNESNSATKNEHRTKGDTGHQGQSVASGDTNKTKSSGSRSSQGSVESSSLDKNSAKSHQRSGSQSSSTSGSQKSHSSVSQKLPKPDDSVNQSVKKEQAVTQSTKHPPISNREPLLQSLNQELIGHSKSDSQKLSSKPVSANVVNKTTERTEKVLESKSSSDPRAVLKEKEENRNVNGAKIKSRPRIQIPENVEDMLQEFTSGVPLPVTEIQTPFKEAKFPFQDKSVADLKHRDFKNEMSGITSHRRSIQLSPQAGRTLPVEEIKDKDTSSSSSDDSSSDDNDDNSDEADSSDENVEKEQKHEEEDVVSKVKPEPVQKLTVNPVPTATATPVPVNRNTQAAPEKSLQQMKMHSNSSSDSSSSESGESSDSGSDSESGNEKLEKEGGKAGVWPGNNTDIATPSRQWNLKSFLPQEPTHILNAKPPSYEAPPSDKSEDLDEVEKRAADQVISDENPPSNDQDLMSKRSMSADEFSPPAPIDKHPVLSPIKSPQAVKSPVAKRSNHRMNAAEKLQRMTTVDSDNVKYPNTYDYIKNRERKTSLSKASPNLSDCDKSPIVRKRGRKPKQKVKSQAYANSNSESESEIDVVNTSRSSLSDLNSPHKSLPINQQKSHASLGRSGSLACSNKPVTSSAKRKEGKREKLLKEKDSVKLKPDCSTGVPEKLTNCDSSKAASKASHRSFTDSIDQILDSFHDAKPVSPIPNYPNIDNKLQVPREDHLRKAGLAVSPIKLLPPLNGNISYINGKAALLVKIDLNKLTDYMCLDKNSANFLKPIHEFSPKHQKVTSAKSNAPNVTNHRKSHSKVLNEIVPDKLQIPKSIPNRTSPSDSSSITNDGRSSLGSKQSDVAVKSNEKASSDSRKFTSNSVHNVKVESGIPDFYSLPEREPSAPAPAASRLSDGSDSDSESGSSGSSSGSSSSSDSDSEHEDSTAKRAVSASPAHVPPESTNHSSSVMKSPSDVKKRKLEAFRADDSKRRKMAANKSPSQYKRTAAEISHSEPVSESLDTSSRPLVPVKRERRTSASSQHSTNSNLSQHSNSRQHKRARSGAAGNSATAAPSVDRSSNCQDLKASSTPISTPVTQPQDKSSSAAATSNKHISHDRFEPPEVVKPVNGYIPSSDQPSRPRANIGYSLLANRHEEERLKSSDDYHRQAKKYKYQADDMSPCVMKHVLYLESALCFMESGCAMERDHMITDASKMYKDTFQFVMHEYHQLNRESQRNSRDSRDKPEQKLSVLCQRIQALVYMKLYLLKKNETLKLKRVLDDANKSTILPTSQPKPPSAPSPHQTNWNRSTGTPSPMSPAPSPANSVCSVGSVGGDQTPAKLSNGTSGQAHVQPPPGSIVVPQRIHSITQKYISNTSYLVNGQAYWDQADDHTTTDIRDYFIQLDHEVGPLTLHSNLQHLIRYVRLAIKHLNV